MTSQPSSSPTSEVAILVPVLGRPHRVKPTVEAFQSTAPFCRMLFVCDEGDDAEENALIAVIEEFGERLIDYSFCNGNYAEKIAHGLKMESAELIFTAADDLVPRPGWFERAKAYLHGGVQVVGVNDLIRRKRDHQTHFLMTREYAEQPTIDEGPGPFHQGYFHWFCDDEFIATAKHRGVYAYARNSIVRHLHPMTGTAPDDDTYRKGRENQRLDRHLFRQRARLWT